MSAGLPENESGRADATPDPALGRTNAMSSTNSDVKTSPTDDTHRDLIATSDDRVIDANAVYTRHFAGAGVVVFAATFERTEHGLRWDGDAPVFTAAVESEQAIRESLAGAGYRTHDVNRALRDDHRLTDSRADAAARAAGGCVMVTDGGTETHRVWIADCDDCGWQSAHDNKADAENARFAHEDTAQTGTGGPWHQAIVRWEDVTDGGPEAR